MKKTLLLTGALFLFICSTTLNAQTDTTPVKPQLDTTQMVQPATPAMATNSTDRWNNYSPEKYKMLPMPEALTTEKIFPVIGKYTLTDKEGNSTEATLSLDETNKGVVWIEGLPQGRIKALLLQSPGTYLIPAQKLADEKELKAAGEANRNMSAGVMVFNKDANTLDICIGCAYKNEDPGSAFVVATEEPVAEEEATTKAKTKTKKATAKSKAKEKPVKTWKYSGTKVVETTASIVPMQQ